MDLRAAIIAFAICVAGAALEGALAGRGVRARFAELRQPRYSPSLTVWFLIGGVYYIICFVLLYRLLASMLPTAAHKAAFVLLLVLMAANALWGFLFFRRRDLQLSFLAFLPYGLVGIALALVLVVIDLTAALVFIPYLIYLGYAAWWSHRLWALNRASTASRQ
jgi:translocator protein